MPSISLNHKLLMLWSAARDATPFCKRSQLNYAISVKPRCQKAIS